MADLPDLTDQPGPRPRVAPPAGTADASEVEVDLAAFLPEGVQLATDPGPDGAEEGEPASDLSPAGSPDGDRIDLELLGHLEADLDAVGVALAALDDGSYGCCAVCTSPIPPEVLAQDPVRRTCDAHLPVVT